MSADGHKQSSVALIVAALACSLVGGAHSSGGGGNRRVKALLTLVLITLLCIRACNGHNWLGFPGGRGKGAAAFKPCASAVGPLFRRKWVPDSTLICSGRQGMVCRPSLCLYPVTRLTFCLEMTSWQSPKTISTMLLKEQTWRSLIAISDGISQAEVATAAGTTAAVM